MNMFLASGCFGVTTLGEWKARNAGIVYQFDQEGGKLDLKYYIGEDRHGFIHLFVHYFPEIFYVSYPGFQASDFSVSWEVKKTSENSGQLTDRAAPIGFK